MSPVSTRWRPTKYKQKIIQLFGYKRNWQLFNKDGATLDRRALILFKIHTFDRISKNIVFLGCCPFELFDKEKQQLKTGGYQIRIFSKLPKTPKGGADSLTEDYFKDVKHIPCLTLCLRILPGTCSYTAPPPYKSGYYESSSTQPDNLEKEFFKHYFKIRPYEIINYYEVNVILKNTHYSR